VPFRTSGSWPGSRTTTSSRSVLCGCWRACRRTIFRPNRVRSITAGAFARRTGGDAPDLYRRSNRQAQVPGQTPGGEEVIIAKRILYIDSEGWFITASDQYDREASSGRRSRPSTHITIVRCQKRESRSPFKRMFQTALVDEDLQDGFSTVVYMSAAKRKNESAGISTRAWLPSHFSILTSSISRPTEARFCPLRLASELLREVCSAACVDEEETSWRNRNLKNRR